MDPLRARLIRLAHSDAELRPHLLPILREGSDEATLEAVRRAVARAYRTAHRQAISKTTLEDAVKLPADTRRTDIKAAAVLLFTEYPGLSQYENDRFWAALGPALTPLGLYYDWYDGGVAGIYRG